MKKTLLAIGALLIALASFGQTTDVYKSAHFDGATCISTISNSWVNMTSHVTIKTFEMWVKLDSVNTADNSYLYYVPGRSASSSSGSHSTATLVGMYISPDTTLHCVFDNNEIHAKLHDTEWHHVAFICDGTTHSGHDTLVIYIDGVYQTDTSLTTNNIVSAWTNFSYISGRYDDNIGVYEQYFHGNMCNFTIADSAIYDVYPNCVFDTTMFWSGG